MAITLRESFRAVFYTPFYLPLALGAFEREGVEVGLATSPGLDRLAEHLRDRPADIHWGGPMRILVQHDRDPASTLVGFAEAVTRDPFFLVGRSPSPGFRLEDLRAVLLATVSEVPTPWMCLQDDIRRAGIDPASINRVAGGTMAANADALRVGEVDAIQTFQPIAEQLVREGTGHVWYAAASRGPCSYTTLYALRETVERRADELYRMTRALHRSQRWLHAHDADTVAAAVGDFFPEVPRDLLSASIDRYLDAGIWGRDPRLPRDGFERLRACLLSGGLIRREVPYEDCVDMRLADASVADDPPAA